jgi:hypothetical protein
MSKKEKKKEQEQESYPQDGSADKRKRPKNRDEKH